MRALVSAATKHGATAEIATAIGKGLREHGVDADVASPQEVSDISQYGAVVIGSAVYAGHWLEPAKAFINRFADQLPKRPVWLFSSGPIGDPPKPAEDPADVAVLLGTTKARGHELFAGAIDKGKLGFAERAIVGMLRASEGDFRDWIAIEAWARSIAEALREPTQPSVKEMP